MRIFHIAGDQFTELDSLPDALPSGGYLWIGSARIEFAERIATVQGALQRWTGGQLVDLHISDLLNDQLPSHYDDTSWYDLLVFRRLAAGTVAAPPEDTHKRGPQHPLAHVDTSPVGFAVFDRVLLTVHPNDCMVREFFAQRLQQQTQGAEVRAASRLPPSPPDLMLRMVNHMVDSYLELRRTLTKNLDTLQQSLFDPRANFISWKTLLDSRNSLHLLEDTCEDQRAAIVEWIDALAEWPPVAEPAAQRDRELLRVRSRDVLEHIERVLSHVRRLESSIENAVQMHFSAQGNRTNEIMRTLTVLTAIFMPLNLVTGFFGMNFEGLPLIHSARGFWVIFTLMLFLGIALSWWFWRKRYLGRSR